MAPLIIRSATSWELSAIPMFVWMGEKGPIGHVMIEVDDLAHFGLPEHHAAMEKLNLATCTD